jgi:hypothetical protein
VATAGTALDLTFQADITGINFSLERGPVIGGLIADRATQAGIAGATVTISRPDGTTVASMMSSSSGFYRIVDLEPGMYYVQAGRTDYVGTSYGGSDCQPCATVAGAPLRLVAGQPPVTLNFTLTRGASISGRVTKAETGNAVSSAIVELYDSAGIRVLYAVTPVSGAYSIRGLPPGSYYLRASGQGVTVSYPDAPCVGACNPVSGTPIVVQAGAALAGFDFALRDGVSFSGTVLKGQSRYAGAVIRVLDSGGTLLGTLFSASNGAFGGMLPPGTYTLLARIPGRSEEYGNDITVPAVFPQVFVFPDDSCEYALEAPVLMPMSGGGGQSAVTTTAGCAWTATTDANWNDLARGQERVGHAEEPARRLLRRGGDGLGLRHVVHAREPERHRDGARAAAVPQA